ncbi:protein ecdysoneless [Teleopsis dalmanni]|uniref:protein ecdysoneless n=1 Tax=Teleopsis dalmanni TaxID=139649 RepID=UPI0018CF7768|nr:protein ecdysoneless [Teleopsis dalmanni]
MAGINLDFVREDDYIEYFVYPQLPETVVNSAENSAAVTEVENFMQDFLKKCKIITEKIITTREYIWHKDDFQLHVRTGSEQENLLNNERKQDLELLPPHLHGVTHYGDNIADEWFIVFVLYELTREIADCIVRVTDSDGEFLLIEAADALPRWANPDTCEQRVYIANGNIKLVQNSPSNSAKILPVEKALSKIRLNPNLYCVSKEIEDCINERLKEFVDLSSTYHHQIVRLPVGVAAILKVKPSLIASSVRAFCERDSIDMRACRSMLFFPPEQRVRVNVRFTRCLYAMILQANYVPDRKIGWNLSNSTNTEEYKEDLLGVKIACGFEILTSQTKNAKSEENDQNWLDYRKSLTSKGYFRNNIEGSAEYIRLLNTAREFFNENNGRFRTNAFVGNEIIDILKSADINVDQFRDEENNLKPSDCDDWLNINAEQLDAMLQERYGPRKLYKPDGDIDAAEFTKNITDFLEKQSQIEGIENDPEEVKRDKDEIKDKLKKNHSMRRACKQNSVITEPKQKSTNNDKLDDESSFSTHVRNFLDFVIPEDNWDSNSEMSDYEDDDDLERNIESMTNTEMNIDTDIKTYMAQMDKELSKTTIGQTYDTSKERKMANGSEDDFDDIESFNPVNINVNVLKNMMDSYKLQVGGPGPVSNLMRAMGAGMSVGVNENDETNNLTESTV